jgi:PASTA domain
MSTPMPPPPPGVTPPRPSFWRRPIGRVLPAFVALAMLGGILSACGEPAEETAASPTDVPSVVTSVTPTATTPTPSVERVAVPRVVGIRLENAKDLLKETDVQVNVVRKYSSKPSGTVLSQSVSAGTEVRPGRTIRLVISKGPKPQPSPKPCTSGYSPCLVYHGGADYDCYGGSGDGPYYTEPGVVYTVSGSDPYGLDADNNGSGCE